jgi:hypothetical protein
VIYHSGSYQKQQLRRFNQKKVFCSRYYTVKKSSAQILLYLMQVQPEFATSAPGCTIGSNRILETITSNKSNASE